MCKNEAKINLFVTMNFLKGIFSVFGAPRALAGLCAVPFCARCR